jgi:hypothetical protein
MKRASPAGFRRAAPQSRILIGHTTQCLHALYLKFMYDEGNGRFRKVSIGDDVQVSTSSEFIVLGVGVDLPGLLPFHRYLSFKEPIYNTSILNDVIFDGNARHISE